MARWQRLKWLARRGLLLALVALLLSGEAPPLAGFDARLDALVRSQRFDFITWDLGAIAAKLRASMLDAPAYLTEAQRKQVILDYLHLVRRIDELSSRIEAIYANPQTSHPENDSADLRRELAALKADKARRQPLVEAIIQEQIASVLADEGFGWFGQVFPPVAFHFTALPMQLIISPRNVIRYQTQASLTAGLPVEQQAALEEAVDRGLDVSSLVVPLGGLALYPAMLLDSSSLEYTIKDAAHEWTHHWLLLRPLGWNYDRSSETRTINETAATLVGNEVGTEVIARYYPEFAPKNVILSDSDGPTPPDPLPPAASPSEPAPPAFDYRAEMHTTRVTADRLLAEGQIDAAEAYMEARRRFFVEHGYLIRKLNQAYFAFYGAYADQPGERGEDPIGPAVVRLRARSP